MEYRACDQCSVAIALVHFDLRNGGELAMCAHHADEALVKLAPLCNVVIDLRHVQEHA